MSTIKLFLFVFIISVAKLSAQSQPMAEYHLLVGTFATEGKPNGIHVFRFNTESGEFQPAQPLTELGNASWLTVSKDRQNVYAISDGPGGGKVNAFAFDAVSGALRFMNSVAARGPAYVAVDDNKQFVFSGNYGGGNVLAVGLNSDGSFSAADTQLIQHEGSSVVKERQEKPHVHAAVLSLDGRYLLVPDLGTDKVYQYRVNATQKQILEPSDIPFLEVKPGGGPRHLAFHRNGKYAYLVLELDGSVMALDYHNGKLEAKQTISMVTAEFKGRLSGADIHVSPDGKFLYASNRGDANEIAIYSISKKGKLALIDRQSVLGKMPRNFVIDPTGKFLLVANQVTNDIIIFKRDHKTGLLTATGKKIEVDKPVCLQFATIGK
jgi:6-phosphogluconolactonase